MERFFHSGNLASGDFTQRSQLEVSALQVSKNRPDCGRVGRSLSKMQVCRKGSKLSTFLMAKLRCKSVLNNWLELGMVLKGNQKIFKLQRGRKALYALMTRFGNMQNGRGILPETNSHKGLSKAQVCRNAQSLYSSCWLLFAAKVPWTLAGEFSLQTDGKWLWSSKEIWRLSS